MTKLSPVASIPFDPMCWFLNDRIVLSDPLPRIVMCSSRYFEVIVEVEFAGGQLDDIAGNRLDK